MSIIKASQNPYRELDIIPTGLPNLDRILGVGGVPSRKILEISGVYSVGKSTLSLMIIAQAQKMGKKCLLADIEFSFEESYAEKLGVNLDKLELVLEKTAEEALNEIEEWAQKNKNSLIVIDAIGALLPREESEKQAGERMIGGQARLVATFCRKIVPLLAINNIALVVLNHQFTNIMTGRLQTSGGAKLEFHRSIWLMLKRGNKRIMSGENQVGDIIEAEIRKNKLAPTLKQSTELQLIYGQGFNRQADLMETAKEKLFTKEGQFYMWNGERVGRGEKGLREAFANPSFAAKIQAAL